MSETTGGQILDLVKIVEHTSAALDKKLSIEVDQTTISTEMLVQLEELLKNEPVQEKEKEKSTERSEN